MSFSLHGTMLMIEKRDLENEKKKNHKEKTEQS